MRQLLMLLFVVVLNESSKAQIQVGVWTDQPVYLYGDTVRVTVTAFNPTLDTVHLSFPDSRQANYIVDEYNLYSHIGAWLVLTSATIPPKSSIDWENLRYPGMTQDQGPLSIGVHALVGEVLGYGKSDTVLIIVAATTSVSEVLTKTGGFALGHNYPNPFNGVTRVPFDLTNASRARMEVYNELGQRVCTVLDREFGPGSHLANIDLGNMPSGPYWCRLEVGGRSQTVKLVLVR